MPMFEYRCHDCSQTFEALVRSSETAQCPSCQSQTLEKLISVFAMSGTSKQGSSVAESAPSCGPSCGCGPASC
jgi:putative FmdB family regulatory protein